MNFYKNYFHTILVFSPTIHSDEKWDYIKNQSLLVRNKPLERWIKELKAKKQLQNGVVSKPAVGIDIELDHEWDPKIPEDCFFDDYDEDRLMGIMEEQMQMITLLKKHNKPKYMANRILIIFDDLVGSALFAGTRGSYFKGVNTRHRHYSASFLMVSQGYKEIPKTIRSNWTCLVVFEIGNEKEVQVIYEEYAMGLKSDDWLEVYRHATDKDHSFLFINYQKPKRLRMMRNFESVLFIE